jgi:hypothetical protein
MQRRSLGIVAIILIALMAIVATAGLDDLPRSLRQSVEIAGTQLSADRASFEQNRNIIQRAIQSEPALFQNKAAIWGSRIEQDASRLDTATAALASAQQLAKANRRTDADKLQRALSDLDSIRKTPIQDVSELRAEAERWLAAKRALPGRLETMRASYSDIQAFDVEAATAPARKAIIDWPERRADLETRLNGLKELQSKGRQTWDSSARLRESAAAGSITDSDCAALLNEADKVDSIARQTKEGAAALNALAGQLYVSWDKLLITTSDNQWSGQKVRTVRTRFPDATLTHGETTSEERWESVDSARMREARRNAGMVVEHKSAGKYDSEAERVVQPPAYAYVAPPGQSNNYGSWSSGVWRWLPEYLILGQLLHASRGPIALPDYDAYDSARRRGEIFYGRNDARRPGLPDRRDGGSYYGRTPSSRPSGSVAPPASAPSGGWSQDRAKPAWGGRGYAGSQYQSKGNFAGSQYQSRGTYRSGGGSIGARSYARGGGSRSFSRGGRR